MEISAIQQKQPSFNDYNILIDKYNIIQSETITKDFIYLILYNISDKYPELKEYINQKVELDKEKFNKILLNYEKMPISPTKLDFYWSLFIGTQNKIYANLVNEIKNDYRVDTLTRAAADWSINSFINMGLQL